MAWALIDFDVALVPQANVHLDGLFVSSLMLQIQKASNIDILYTMYSNFSYLFIYISVSPYLYIHIYMYYIYL